MKKLYGTILGCLAALALTAAPVTRDSHGITVPACDGRMMVSVEFFTPSTVRVVKYPASAGRPERESLVVLASPENVRFSVKETEREVQLATPALRLTVDLTNGALTYDTPKGVRLLQEGETTLTPITEGVDKGAYVVGQAFLLDKDEPVYGIGLLQYGKMSQRGENREMQQSNLEDFSHSFQSIKGYGIYWDNYSVTDIRDDGQSLSLISRVGLLADYYFMYGGNLDGVVAATRHLTGDVPMFPRWTYGYWQSRERYASQEELLEVVDRHRQLQVPLDGIIQDWQYWGNNYLWNAMEFLNENFQSAQQMIDRVHRQNAHMIISIWASFGPQTKQYRELDAKGLLFDFETWPRSGLSFWPPRMEYPSGVRVYDAYSSEARDIYWKYLSKMNDMKIDGWWMDSTDPDHHSYKDSDLDELTATGTSYRSVRNIYPLMTVGGVYDHQRAADSSHRVFILTRSFFTGQQRYGANTWTGDTQSSWSDFRTQIPMCLNYTLTGLPHVNTDIGGFFASSYNGGNNSAPRNPLFQELYVRWMQFGAFCPMMRSHGTDIKREIYYFGEKGEPVFDALDKQIRMRYELLPYIYSTSWQVSRHNDSFMRALVMDFPEDRNVWDMGLEFMFGRAFLVAPVTKALYTSERAARSYQKSSLTAGEWQGKTFDVYLPAGAVWYDYWTNQRYDGGQTIAADAPLDRIPLYVRAGSIVPKGPEVQYADEKVWDALDLTVYPGADASFTLYDDEGDNYNYEKGLYSTIPLKWNDRSRTLTIGRREGSYPGMPAVVKFTVHLPGGQVRTVSYSGAPKSVKL